MSEPPAGDRWHVYILQCGDGTLYTGIAKDPEKRLEEHRNGRGAKYLRGRGPLKMVFHQLADSHGEALRLESKIKKLPRPEKLKLIKM